MYKKTFLVLLLSLLFALPGFAKKDNPSTYSFLNDEENLYIILNYATQTHANTHYEKAAVSSANDSQLEFYLVPSHKDLRAEASLRRSLKKLNFEDYHYYPVKHDVYAELCVKDIKSEISDLTEQLEKLGYSAPEFFKFSIMVYARDDDFVNDNLGTVSYFGLEQLKPKSFIYRGTYVYSDSNVYYDVKAELNFILAASYADAKRMRKREVEKAFRKWLSLDKFRLTLYPAEVEAHHLKPDNRMKVDCGYSIYMTYRDGERYSRYTHLNQLFRPDNAECRYKILKGKSHVTVDPDVLTLNSIFFSSLLGEHFYGVPRDAYLKMGALAIEFFHIQPRMFGWRESYVSIKRAYIAFRDLKKLTEAIQKYKKDVVNHAPELSFKYDMWAKDRDIFLRIPVHSRDKDGMIFVLKVSY